MGHILYVRHDTQDYQRQSLTILAPQNYTGVMAMGFSKPYDIIPAAGGGGCMTDGPFKK